MSNSKADETAFDMADEAYERMAHEMFPFDSMSPEEYAARNGHGWFCFSFGSYSYRDKKLQDWLHRLGEILPSEALLEQYRQQFLTAEEIKQIRDKIQRVAIDGI